MAAAALPARAHAGAPSRAHLERVRLGAFAVLGFYAALHWAALITPAPGGKMLLSLLIALAGGAALISIPDGASDVQRRLVTWGVAFALLVLALLVAGVPLRLLWPKHWDDLWGGFVDGIGATPAITVPYRGVDEWVRIAILSGGTALLALAALLAFWPRRTGTVGHPIAAAVALGTLWAVPIIEHGPKSPYLDGAVFSILLAGFLWLERVRSDQLAVGAACVLGAVVIGSVVAPRIDNQRPWFNYEAFAEKLEPKRAEAFSWTHSYGPLNWPRDGREMLRIKAKSQSYWKAANLDEFDGLRWRQGPPSRDQQIDQRINPRWLQTIKVVDRGLRSNLFVGAGEVKDILPGSSRVPLPQADGTFVTANKPLKPGDSYQAQVYVPNPSDNQLKRSGTDYPDWSDEFLEVRVPLQGASSGLVDRVSGQPLGPNALIRFQPYNINVGAGIVWPSGFGIEQDGDAVLDDSPYARLYALALALKRETSSPYEFVKAVEDRVRDGAQYDESPPQTRYPLATFLFDTKSGYCQQFSGTMALMLRMGGIPARVASGFSPGSYNSERKDYVVRDTDAHSWVEAYFPPYGWITYEPTPAASPATAQLDDSGTSPNGGPTLPPNFGRLGQAGDRPFAPGDPGADIAPSDSGGLGWKLPVAVALVVLTLLAVGIVLWRRRTPFETSSPELAELQRALHRSGRDPAPDVTLARLESLLGGSKAAAGYVRAVRDQRYSPSAPGPTSAQRRALRQQLASGLGLRGVLRAWWALPPAAFKSRLRRPYTGT